MKNYFQGSMQNPYHISIGAVVMNDNNEVCCHYFRTFSHPAMGTFDDFYLLMRETIEPDETIERCLARGLKEEFGIQATLHSFIGSIVSRFLIPKTHITMEKTTLYFLCDFVDMDLSKRASNDPESVSEIRWMKPQDLRIKMIEQGKRSGREDIDESKILEKLISSINQ